MGLPCKNSCGHCAVDSGSKTCPHPALFILGEGGVRSGSGFPSPPALFILGEGGVRSGSGFPSRRSWVLKDVLHLQVRVLPCKSLAKVRSPSPRRFVTG